MNGHHVPIIVSGGAKFPFILADGLGNYLAAMWRSPFATVDPNLALRFSSEPAANTFALQIGAPLKALRAF